MRVLSWNLYHGRDFPPDPALFTLRSRLLRITERNATHAQVNRPLLDEFARVLDGLEWDVALLQEAPPRWFAELASPHPLERRARAHLAQPAARRSSGGWRTSTPTCSPRATAARTRSSCATRGACVEHRRLTLAWRPEQRRMHWARLELPGGARVCVANLHASAGPARAGERRGGAARPRRRVEWSGGDPLVFGGDLNLRPARTPEPFATLRERFGLQRADRSATRSTTCSRAASTWSSRPGAWRRPSAS